MGGAIRTHSSRYFANRRRVAPASISRKRLAVHVAVVVWGGCLIPPTFVDVPGLPRAAFRRGRARRWLRYVHLGVRVLDIEYHDQAMKTHRVMGEEKPPTPLLPSLKRS